MNSALYVRRFSLNLIRDLTKACSDLSRRLDSENLLDLVTTWAGQFCSRCKLVLYFLEQPSNGTTSYSSQGDCSLEHWLEKLQ